MKIIECPRDAMQGLETFIDTEQKVAYINELLKIGFDTIDFGSFVSAKAIPQMRDTADVLRHLQRNGSNTKLLAIVANVRGAEEALAWREIDYLGFPLSISETFQLRNTNKSIAAAFESVKNMQAGCEAEGKRLVTYISMGFGNPYGDPYSVDVVLECVDRLATLGVSTVSLADTVGVAQPDQIEQLFSLVIERYPSLEWGAHLHARPASARAKIRAAHLGGCQRLDGALGGYGGCPMANDELMGNVPTETIIEYLEAVGEPMAINQLNLHTALHTALKIFPKR
jgi:hydroxymethylglutaryl-CoA lyase